MSENLNRRKFLRGSAVAGAAALATPAIAANHGETLKMQAAWGGGIFLENAQSFAARAAARSSAICWISRIVGGLTVMISVAKEGVAVGGRMRSRTFWPNQPITHAPAMASTSRMPRNMPKVTLVLPLEAALSPDASPFLEPQLEAGGSSVCSCGTGLSSLMVVSLAATLCGRSARCR